MASISMLVAALALGVFCLSLQAQHVEGVSCNQVLCEMHCEFGWGLDYRGCPTCTCRTTHPCAATTCAVGYRCEINRDPCTSTPCSPSKCVPVTPVPNTYDPCEGHVCQAGSTCEPQAVMCVSPPCNPIPACVEIPRCHKAQAVGTCRASHHKFYFNKNNAKCEPFIYGGCGGNDNNFGTFEECRQVCGHTCPPVCRIGCQFGNVLDAQGCPICECKPDPCQDHYCEPGNKCTPKQLVCVRAPCPADFHAVCEAVPQCQLPSEVGRERASMAKYYFNKDTKKCELFTYGGVGGNTNNFDSFEDCRNTCGHSCPGVCLMFCQFGNVLTDEGCPICECKPDPCQEHYCEAGTKCKSVRRYCTRPPCAIPFAAICETVSQCHVPKDVGPGRAALTKYYFNTETKKCQTFTYGGLGGNTNKFDTFEQCKQTCGHTCPPLCRILCDFGNVLNGEGCPICQCNEDPCKSHYCAPGSECKAVRRQCLTTPCPASYEATCHPITECNLPKVVGPCEAIIPKYFFNTNTKLCERFEYGGCQGNANNFASFSECRQKCVRQCPPLCRMACPYGFELDNNGCEICQCKPHPCAALLCPVGKECKVRQLMCVTTPCPVAFTGSCETTEQCSQAAVPGPCTTNYATRYYFDKTGGQCAPFRYGGCHGNLNNFPTYEDCRRACGGPPGYNEN